MVYFKNKGNTSCSAKEIDFYIKPTTFKENSFLFMHPNHVAIIMDGNRRWATKQHVPINRGHKKGAETLMEFCKAFKTYNIPYLTVYAFSSENNRRTDDEKEKLFVMLDDYLSKDIKTLHNEQVSVHFIGNFSIFNSKIQEKIHKINTTNIPNSLFTFTVALNYGGQQEITRACNELLASGKRNITADDITHSLYSPTLPEVDLLIRTGGSQRLSNFLLWQCAYAELYFCQCLWPDFNQDEFQKTLNFYKNQKRNFGM